ncbi:hypothetical protein BJ742DRAFT_825319 [Cladochytrium replicatum]|nr:hypothetical protein BJ742DRAFT_825319 [Cladochytrium replicatum]
MDGETQLNRSRKAVSFTLLVFAIVAFVVQSEIVQYIQGKLDYNKPWFLLYFAHSSYTMILPIQFLWFVFLRKRHNADRSVDDEDLYKEGNNCWRGFVDFLLGFALLLEPVERALASRAAGQRAGSLTPKETVVNILISTDEPLTGASVNNSTSAAEESSPLLPERTTEVSRLNLGERRLVLWLLFTTALKLATVFSVASYAWYVAVTRISMPDLTAIYDSSCVFVYILSAILLRYRLKISKSFAVIITIVGIGFISGWATPPNVSTGEPDAQALYKFPFSPVVGFTAAILSSIGAALCEVLFKKWAVSASPHPPSKFLSFFFTGMIGLVSFVFLWIGFPILHYTGFETFDPIPTENLSTWAIAVGLNAFSGLLYNVSFNLLVAIAGPVFASFGIMLTIPIMGVSDAIATGNPVGTGTIIGSACILVGFAILSFQAED